MMDLATIEINLAKANLEHADLKTINLSYANLQGAKANKQTIFPHDFDARAAGVGFVDED